MASLSNAAKRRLRAAKAQQSINLEKIEQGVPTEKEKELVRPRYSREQYKQWGLRAVKICNPFTGGEYHAPSGQVISIRPQLDFCLSRTHYYAPTTCLDIPEVKNNPNRKIEMTSESSLEAATRLFKLSIGKIAVLNFASAHNPGGGFLNGSFAQEETSARSSALYSCLTNTTAGQQFYKHHESIRSTYYSDALVYAEGVPVFATNDGSMLLEKPYTVDFVSMAAVNCLRGKISPELPRVVDTMRIRIQRVLSACMKHGATHLVLGAFGCGVFSNSPRIIGQLFAECLKMQKYQGFTHIIFALHSRSIATDEFKSGFASVQSVQESSTLSSNTQENKTSENKSIVQDLDGYWAIENLLPAMKQINSSRNIILVLSGSFNPIHTGHIMMLEEARKHLEEEEKENNILAMILAPSSDEYLLKKLGKDAIPLDKRVKLCRFAVESSGLSARSQSMMHVCDWGTAKVETLMDTIESEFARLNPNNDANVWIGMVAGADDMVRRAIWNKSRLIPVRRLLVAISRENIKIAIEEKNQSQSQSKENKQKYLIQSPRVPHISSTVIRQAMLQGKSALDKLVKQGNLSHMVAQSL